MANNEHLKLLMRREGKVVLGKHLSNLWLLTMVLVATFISIAFSNGSLNYLNEKMNDPFTNWVNIKNDRVGYEKELHEALQDIDIQDHFGFTGIQADVERGIQLFCNKNNQSHYFQIRYFEHMSGSLIAKVLDQENVIGGHTISPEKLADEMMGVIITQDALAKLGYSLDSVPAFVDYHAYSDGIDTLVNHGVIREKISQDAGSGDRTLTYYRAPLPVIAVVKRLPLNMDLAASKYLLNQDDDNVKSPLVMTHKSYFNKLLYYVSDKEYKHFCDVLAQCIPDSLLDGRRIEDNVVLDWEDETLLTNLQTWKPGRIVKVCIGDEYRTPISAFEAVAQGIEQRLPKTEVARVFEYNVSTNIYPHFSYLSLSFATLDSIRSFERFVKKEYKVQVEMSQVNSKENFQAVSTMAQILSWAMVVFAIVCILIFIVNMLQSYFLKVKRNLGTFKAFGISSSDLINVYVVILFVIIIAAIIIALAVAWAAEGCLPWFGILKDDKYSYLSLWQANTLQAILIIVVATLVTVMLLMRQLLKQTPGDLIYDRN